MKCSFCNDIALFKCACPLPFFCPSHFGHHLANIPNHLFEKIDITIPSPKLDRINSEIINRISIIKLAKADISAKTKSLINLLESVSKDAKNKLDNIFNHLIELLGRQKFSQSEVQSVEKIDSTKLKSKKCEVNGIFQLINETYSGELINEFYSLESKQVQFLKKHCSGFLCGALTDDGQKLVIGCSDSTLRVWNLSENRQDFVLTGHNSEVNCLTLINNSRFILSGSSDNSIRIWNLPNKVEESLLKGHKSSVLSICFIETKSHIISGGLSGELIIWDFINRRKIKNIIAPGSIYSLIKMRTKEWLVFASGAEIVFFCLKTYKVVNILKEDEFSVRCMALTRDEKVLICGFYNNSIYTWNLENFENVCKMFDTPGVINSLAITPDDKFIVSGSSDSPISIWGLENGIKIKTFERETSGVVSISTYNENFILLFSKLNIGYFQSDFSNFQLNGDLIKFKLETLNINSKSNLIGFAYGIDAFVFDRNSDNHVSLLKNHERLVQFIEISNDDKFALTGTLGKKNNLIFWDLGSNEIIGSLAGHSNSVLCASFSKDSFKAVTGSADRNVILWDLRGKSIIFKLSGHINEVCSIKFMENENFAVSAGNDMNIFIWDLKNQSKLQVIAEHKDKISKLFIIKEDKYIISCDKTDGIRVWNVPKKQPKIIQSDVGCWLERKSTLLDLLKRYIKY